MDGKKIIIIGTILTLGGLFAFVYMESNKPQPGEKIEDLGREHMETGKTVTYNSNPPTSGSHYSDWTRAGVLAEVKDDRNLIHSMEHGYVIMWYKCQGVGPAIIDNPSLATQSAQVIISGECKTRQDQLKQIFDSKGPKKLIVAPRDNLETNFAMTAWNRIEKLNDFDRSRVEQFINAYRDQGPERTME